MTLPSNKQNPEMALCEGVPVLVGSNTIPSEGKSQRQKKAMRCDWFTSIGLMITGWLAFACLIVACLILLTLVSS